MSNPSGFPGRPGRAARRLHCARRRCAIGFDQRIGQWLAALARDLAPEMLALALHQLSQLSENLDPLMGFQPSAAVGEQPSGSLDLAVERRPIVALEPSNRRPVESLNDLNHDCSPDLAAWALSSSRRTRLFSE